MRLAPVVFAFVLSPAAVHAQQAKPANPAKPFSLQELQAASADPKAFTLDPASIRIERLGSRPAPALTAPPAASPQGVVGDIGVIVNIAKSVFAIIKENEPVIDIHTTFANAVPSGVASAAELSGWSAPEATGYRIHAKNLYGVTVVDCTFDVIRQHSGRYHGRGRFLTSVTVNPENVSVAWGYRFGMDFNAPSVANVGTDADPVASMVANVGWSIATVLKHEQGNGSFYLTGTGGFHEVGGEFQDEARESARARVETARERGTSLF